MNALIVTSVVERGISPIISESNGVRRPRCFINLIQDKKFEFGSSGLNFEFCFYDFNGKKHYPILLEDWKMVILFK